MADGEALDRAKFTAMAEGTAEDWAAIGRASMAHRGEHVDRIVSHLKLLDNDYGGFAVDRVERHGSPRHDVVQLGQLVWGKILRGDEFAEFAAIERRVDADAGLNLPRLGPFSTKIAAWATARL